MRKLGITASIMLTMMSPFSASESEKQVSRNAVCVLEPIGSSTVKGLISFSQYSINSPVKVASSIRGLRANNTYSVYIHESGDLTKDEELLREPYPI